MNVLVAYASRHGATQGIAERVAETLREHGLQVSLEPIDRVDSPDRYDAFVLGSAAYMGRWLKEATAFARRHQELLSIRPVWLFSSGPIGHDLIDAKGRDVVKASEPLDFAELEGLLRPREERVFFGAYDPAAEPIGIVERFGSLFTRLPAVREAMPAGDFRDWPAIEAWATGIADALQPGEVATTASA
jgi:menaquinone-dependent protoporphyrinogen oxidase